ncbi:MAG: biotin/lipoyl-binding protein, partial [Methylocystis sp.]|nr:biotin/lipoyl-binding protein [Methylocystis sp.]
MKPEPCAIFRGVLAAALALALGGCEKTKGSAEESRAERPVLVETARYATQSQARDFVATIRPRIEADQGFRVGGKVIKRLVEVGQKVKAGDALATLDEKDLRLQKEQADAEFASAKMALVQAAGEEKRALTLRKQGWVAQAALDRVRASAEEARGRYH